MPQIFATFCSRLLASAVLAALLIHPPAASAADGLPVAIHIDAAKSRGDFRPIWRFFGYDECNFTYQPDGKALLDELGKLGPAQVYIRCHHLMTSGNGSLGMKWGSTNMYTEDAKGNAVYNWTIVDRIFDTYMQAGVKPYVEMGFMPKDLSTRPDLYPTDITPDKRIPADAGQAYPPKDYDKWRELCRRWVAHCVERYGKAEVETWYWEVWNEPDISYWKAKPADYYKLYDYAVDGVRKALPTARVGGPEAASSEKFVHAFLDHCATGDNAATGKKGSPLDFVSFHAKGNPTFPDRHVRMGLSNELNRIDRNFNVIASFPEWKDKPVVIGESDPDGMAARPITEAPQLGYRDTALFASYTADAIARTFELADKHDINILGALTWSFEFENKPYFPGYRILSTHGIDMPILNVFKMLAKMGGARLTAESSADLGLNAMLTKGVRGAPDVSALAALEPKKLTVMLWNYHDDDVAGPSADISLAVNGLPASTENATLTHYRIDVDHSNAYTVWKSMNSPAAPTPEQQAKLVEAGRLAMLDAPGSVTITDGKIDLHLTLPRQAVSLLVLEWK